MSVRAVAPLLGHPLRGQPAAGGYLRPPKGTGCIVALVRTKRDVFNRKRCGRKEETMVMEREIGVCISRVRDVKQALSQLSKWFSQNGTWAFGWSFDTIKKLNGETVCNDKDLEKVDYYRSSYFPNKDRLMLLYWLQTMGYDTRIAFFESNLSIAAYKSIFSQLLSADSAKSCDGNIIRDIEIWAIRIDDLINKARQFVGLNENNPNKDQEFQAYVSYAHKVLDEKSTQLAVAVCSSIYDNILVDAEDRRWFMFPCREVSLRKGLEHILSYNGRRLAGYVKGNCISNDEFLQGYSMSNCVAVKIIIPKELFE